MDSEEQRAKDTAARMLSRQPLPSKKLTEKLRQKGFSPEVVEKTLAYFIVQGYINDLDWAERHAAYCRRKNYGPYRIRQKLAAQGIDAPIISQVLDQPSETPSIRRLLETRYSSRDLSNPKERQKTAAALQRRGFSQQAIYQALFTGEDH